VVAADFQDFNNKKEEKVMANKISHTSLVVDDKFEYDI
jgi:hypothetical protein